MGQKSHLGLGTTGLGAAGAPEPSPGLGVLVLQPLWSPKGTHHRAGWAVPGSEHSTGAEPWMIPVRAAPSAPQQCHSAGTLATGPAVAGGQTGWPLKIPSNPFCDSMQPSPAVLLTAGKQGGAGLHPHSCLLWPLCVQPHPSPQLVGLGVAEPMPALDASPRGAGVPGHFRVTPCRWSVPALGD